MSEIYRHVAGGLLMLMGLGLVFAGIRGFDHIKAVLSGLPRYPFRILEVHAYLPRHSKEHPHWSKGFTL